MSCSCKATGTVRISPVHIPRPRLASHQKPGEIKVRLPCTQNHRRAYSYSRRRGGSSLASLSRCSVLGQAASRSSAAVASLPSLDHNTRLDTIDTKPGKTCFSTSDRVRWLGSPPSSSPARTQDTRPLLSPSFSILLPSRARKHTQRDLFENRERPHTASHSTVVTLRASCLT